MAKFALIDREATTEQLTDYFTKEQKRLLDNIIKDIDVKIENTIAGTTEARGYYRGLNRAKQIIKKYKKELS